MSIPKVVLILGSGPNIGLHTSCLFAAQGYKVALASRSAKPEDSNPDATPFQVDLSDPSSVPGLFTQVKETLGVPSVVIYNGTYSPPSSNTGYIMLRFEK
jgi:NAD(P)-dependent dehydrogenase (short-subunit alcohol dehydrogenase family)